MKARPEGVADDAHPEAVTAPQDRPPAAGGGSRGGDRAAPRRVRDGRAGRGGPDDLRRHHLGTDAPERADHHLTAGDHDHRPRSHAGSSGERESHGGPDRPLPHDTCADHPDPHSP
ncbi:hypothetical protein [Ornithinimicrobium flavum]|uniref:hypothetical protein n=1 Tax=Ornithinimicrobium flavum TaxID=1288636 RepID=UPI001930F596|nr:hypothetical protein [Ornithinimicrobium flavum]